MKHTAFCLFLLLFASPLWAQRLPTTVLPEHYALTFAPHFESDSFHGEAVISVRLATATRSITLHSAEIEFQQVTIAAAGRTQPAKVALHPESDTATLTVDRGMPAGAATIRIKFLGQLNDKLRGFYLSKANGRKYAVTQLAATDARRAFPCFDEPAMKATFDVTLIVDERDTALSNGRLFSDTPGPVAGKHTLKFATSPKMSTYLVAMVVGDFECRTGAADGIPIRICSTADKSALTGFALEAAERHLAFYNNYYGIRYPFGKLDVIAVPDFAAGAMENTAAITFREVLLLADPTTATVATQKNIAAVLSHEIAHMWFGDLVTMQWWDDVWLNEGFATWAANKPLRAWRPEWHTELDDAVATQKALNVDSLRSTRPIRTRIDTPDQINEAFDAIAYEKGAAVLHMVESYVGEDVFRQGVTAYLKKYAYNNATSENFWTEIAAAAGKPANEIMASFVQQPGVPLLSVENKCDGANTSVTLTQQRFFLDPSLMIGPSPAVWRVPVCMNTPGFGSRTCEVMTAARQTFTLTGCRPTVFINAGAKGYYRSEYAVATSETNAVRVEEDLTPAERISQIEDSWALVRTGRYDIGQFLTLGRTLASDTTAAVMQTLASPLEFIDEYLVTEVDRSSYRAWIREVFGPAAQTVGWEPAPAEGDDRRILRGILLSLVGGVGRDPEILRQARALADRYLENPQSIDPTLSTAVLQLASENGDAALYDQFLARIKSAQQPQEYYTFLTALTRFSDPALVNRTLEYALSQNIRTQDAPLIIGDLMGEPEARQQTWGFVKSRWATIEKNLGTFMAIPYIVAATGVFCEANARDDVDAFFKSHPLPAAQRAIQQSLERISTCGGVRSRQEARLAAFLSRRPIGAAR